MRGGIPSAEASGLTIPNRGTIYERIHALGEGAVFRPEDIVGEDNALMADFAALRGHDHIHLSDGWHTGVVETELLRRLPKIQSVMTAWCAQRGISAVETGDRVAWRMGVKEWEPILGYRYYTDGAREYLGYGQMGVRLLPAPDWLRDETPLGRLLRVFHDTPERDVPQACRRTRTEARLPASELRAVIALARSIPFDDTAERPDYIIPPAIIADRIEAWIASRAAEEAA